MSLIAFLLLSFLMAPSWASDSSNLAIIYDQKALKPPVKTTYADIIMGIRQGFGDNERIEEITDGSLQDLSAQVAVVLGNYVVRDALITDLPFPIVVGAVSWTTNAVHGVHITADPALVFESLVALAPTMSNVFIVLDANSRLLNIPDLVASGKQYGIKVIVQQASDIKDAAGIYSRLSTQLQTNDTLWIPPGDRFVNKALLSTLLLRSWQSGFAVISSNPSHVRKGALFSVSPDYFLMGTRLGELAREVSRKPILPIEMRSLRDVKLHINKRMANHMGIKVPDMQVRQFGKSIQIQVQ